MKRATAIAILAWLFVLTSAWGTGVSRASFGFKEAQVSFTHADGSASVQAGSHPFAMTTSIELNTVQSGESELPDGEARNVTVKLPTGFTGDAFAVPHCSNADFINNVEARPSCSNDTVVGVVGLKASFSPLPLGSEDFVHAAVYNVEPPPGVAAKLGFFVLGLPVTVDLSIDQNPPYNLEAHVNGISQVARYYGSVLTVWGDPASPVHDRYRGSCVDIFADSSADEPVSLGDCPVATRERAFTTMPRSCTGPLSSTFEGVAWNTGATAVKSTFTRDASGRLSTAGCGRLGFAPRVSIQPTSQAAESPTGLDLELDIHDEGLRNPEGLAQSDVEKAEVSLPEGMTVNPSEAEGLEGCGEQQVARETAFSQPGDGCPQASKIGTVEVQTPLLEGELLHGDVFLATPFENRFGTLLALYMTVKDPRYGINLLLAGKVLPDPQTGRLTAIFEGLPQQPFSRFHFHFREGARSPLATPPACGAYASSALFTPWANPESVYETAPGFTIVSGVANGPCPAGGAPPFKPAVIAGTQSNAAGSYSPFYLRIVRQDGEQEITRFSTVLPPGLSGNLTGIPFCPESAIEAAREASGRQELDASSCPAASQIGRSLVGVGVGSVLPDTPGRVFLAGPYNGSPLSIVSVTSATVGPFDLGTVVIRFGLNINPVTAQVEVDAKNSDAIPHIVDGIVVHVRDIRVYIDRQGFILNPTSCAPMAIANTIAGTGASIANTADDTTVNATTRFQAANCANLAFKPSFKASTSGKTSRANGASLRVSLTYPKGALGKDANIRSVKVSLPKQLPSRLSTLQKACTAEQFNANPAACPAASRVGVAKAVTPILPVPLEGPAYFVSYGGAKFPELVVVLQGYGVTIDLHGETFISRQGITSSTFKTVPDQPVTSFELTLPQGPGSALAANGSLCGLTKTVLVKRKIAVKRNGHKRHVTRKVRKAVSATLTMPTVFTAQNGMVVKQGTPIEVAGCAKKKAKKATARRAQTGKRR